MRASSPGVNPGDAPRYTPDHAQEAIAYVAELERRNQEEQQRRAIREREEAEAAAAAARAELENLPGVLGRLGRVVEVLERREIPATVRPAKRSILASRRDQVKSGLQTLQARTDREERVLAEAERDLRAAELLLQELIALA